MGYPLQLKPFFDPDSGNARFVPGYLMPVYPTPVGESIVMVAIPPTHRYAKVPLASLALETQTVSGGYGTMEQNSFKFRNDNGSEITAGSKSAQNGKISLVPEAKFRLRIGLVPDGNPLSKQFQIEYRIKKDGELVFGSWIKIT